MKTHTLIITNHLQSRASFAKAELKLQLVKLNDLATRSNNVIFSFNQLPHGVR